ncbi:MAG TPA: hypothetical protein VFE58_08780 [Tepidisphaeraceae bacterium]|jgi:hypothetical protein|nr:hypothetical protein [Tepidisphaeraceae bacterium]
MNAATRITSFICLALLLTGCQSNANFTLTNNPIGPPLVGIGACMNPYLYAYPNWPAEVNDDNIHALESKIIDLHPQFVRIFFLDSWWTQDTDPVIAKNHPGMRQSLIRTIRLAQNAGAQVLLQFWYDPNRYKNPEDVARRFAQTISDLRSIYNLTSIHFATIQNEPNGDGDDITLDQYIHLYRAFNRALRDLHLRDQIQIIGGDLLSSNQDKWFAMLAKDLSPILDGYSMHAYWDAWDTKKLSRRLSSVADIVHAMPANQQRPIYATEFGVRGHRLNPSDEPGYSPDGQPIANTPAYSLQIAAFILESLNHGYAGAIQWDLYDAWYDRKMGYGVIGPAEQNFPLKPGYSLLKLFTHSIPPGSRALQINGSVKDVIITALATPAGTTCILLNRGESKQIALAGLPSHALFSTQTWNVESPQQPFNSHHQLTLPRDSVTFLCSQP